MNQLKHIPNQLVKLIICETNHKIDKLIFRNFFHLFSRLIFLFKESVRYHIILVILIRIPNLLVLKSSNTKNPVLCL